jgi:hypothetical protein
LVRKGESDSHALPLTIKNPHGSLHEGLSLLNDDFLLPVPLTAIRRIAGLEGLRAIVARTQILPAF